MRLPLLLLLPLLLVTQAEEPVGPLREPPPLECRAAALADGSCVQEGSPSNELVFRLRGGNTSLVATLTEQQVGVQCARGVPLGALHSPAFRKERHAALLVLRGCAVPPPPAGLGAALRHMRLAAPTALQLRDLPPSAAVAAAALPPATSRLLVQTAAAGVSLSGALDAALPALVALQVEGVSVGLPLHALPATLQELQLRVPGPLALDGRWAAAVPRLRVLVAHGAPLTADWAVCPPALRSAVLGGLQAAQPGLWTNCSLLETVRVRGGAVSSLPDRWLADLPALRVVSLERLPLAALPAGLLARSPRLEALSLRGCELTTLPPALLAPAPLLRALNVSDNPLVALPTLPAALEALAAARTRLGDTCGRGAAASPLLRARRLRHVLLSRSGATRLCLDWRLSLTRLETLDLTDNNITELRAADMVWARADGVRGEVLLAGNPLRDILYTADDWQEAVHAPPQTSAAGGTMTLRLAGATLRCDCRLHYWLLVARDPATARTLPAVADAVCSEPAELWGRALATLSPAELWCALEPAGCPAAPHGCLCRVQATRPDLVSVHCQNKTQGISELLSDLASWNGSLSVHLEDSGLSQLPSLRTAEELHVAYNNISTLEGTTLAQQLRVLDARHNALTRTYAQYWPPALSVRLAGNPLSCDCRHGADLMELHKRRHQVEDYEQLQCEEGGLLAARGGRCVAGAAGAVWGGALVAAGALLAGAAAGAVLAARYRHRLKAWCAAERDPSDDDDDGECGRHEWDVFVSYAQSDARWVLSELVPRLERRWRVCVHVRDWAVGGWIPAHAARSVHRARRVLAVLSPAYLASRWARHELTLALARAQEDRGSRLLLLLLQGEGEELLQGGQDEVPGLRRHLRRHTWLRRADPWFWDKLAAALPRRPLPPRTTAPRPPPAAALDEAVPPPEIVPPPAATVPPPTMQYSLPQLSATAKPAK